MAVTRTPHEKRLELFRRYESLARTSNDINEHLPRLYQAGQAWEHITEMGVRYGCSTCALLAGQVSPWEDEGSPDEASHPQFSLNPKLISYDLIRHEPVSQLQDLTDPGHFEFRYGDSRLVDIEPTMCLFLDTFHTYEQIKLELFRHADQVLGDIIIHDTETYADQGADGKHPGLWQGIIDFMLAHPEWRETENYPNNNGLMVLSRSIDSQSDWVAKHGNLSWFPIPNPV